MLADDMNVAMLVCPHKPKVSNSVDNNLTGIKSFGVYVPKRRMQRAAIAAAHAWAFPSLKGLGRGERSLCGWDEDVVTMAVEAGRDCLTGGSVANLSSLALASTTSPYADLNNAVLVGAALRVPQSVAAGDTGGSTRAGLSAVIAACQSGGGDRLVIASERRSAKPGSAQELQYGCAAGAVIVGQGNDLIARFLGAETVSVPFFGNFRGAGEEFDYGWEERWIRDEGVLKIVPAAVSRLLERLNVTVDRVGAFGLSGGPIGSDKLVAKALKLNMDNLLPDLQGQVGDTGAAQALLQLSGALERTKAGNVIIIASFAQGCEIAAFEMRYAKPVTGRRGLAGSVASGIAETAYVKMLSFEGHVELDWGMRAETDNKTALTQLYRSEDQILGFVGGKCAKCQAVQFPRMPACVNCGASSSQAPFALADQPAKVSTYTADWLMYTPSPPLYVGLVQFDVGARLLMEMVDVDPSSLDVGTPLRMTFRIKERDSMRHFDRYFWKATPSI
jgi:3-hydroxy-3-methylglutaryl CoA synthase